MEARGIWLAGRERRGRGETIEVRSPFTEDVVGTVATANVDDVAEAVAAAYDCFKSTTRLLPVHKRAGVLERAAGILADRAEDLAVTLARESGKPISLCRNEARRGTEILQLAAESARFVTGEVVPLDALPGADGRIGLAMRTPLGVVAAISPFNAPINLSLQKVAPALAAGCTVVLKPADPTPLTVLKLGEVFAKAGLPPGALSIVPGSAETAQALGSARGVLAQTEVVRKQGIGDLRQAQLPLGSLLLEPLDHLLVQKQVDSLQGCRHARPRMPSIPEIRPAVDGAVDLTPCPPLPSPARTPAGRGGT